MGASKRLWSQRMVAGAAAYRDHEELRDQWREMLKHETMRNALAEGHTLLTGEVTFPDPIPYCVVGEGDNAYTFVTELDQAQWVLMIGEVEIA